MNDLIDFLAEISENPIDLDQKTDWVNLRPLTESEIQQLWDIDESLAEFDYLKAEVQCLLPEERRAEISNREDLTEVELELLGRMVLARDVWQATQTAFWSPVKYEYRHFGLLAIDRERALLTGRKGSGRINRLLEPVGTPTRREAARLARLFEA